MSTIAEVIPSLAYRPAEAHPFQAAGEDFLYLVPSGAVFRMEGLCKDIVALVRQTPMLRSDIVAHFSDKGYDLAEIERHD